MAMTVIAYGHSDKAKYVRLRRLRTIQKASLMLVLLISLLIGLISQSLAAVTALYCLSIVASIVGGAAIAAQWRAELRASDCGRSRGQGT